MLINYLANVIGKTRTCFELCEGPSLRVGPVGLNAVIIVVDGDAHVLAAV